MQHTPASARAADPAPDPAQQTPLLRHLVAGQWRSSDGAELISTNPARPEETVATGHLAGHAELDEAVAAARADLPARAALPHRSRGRVPARAADRLDARAAEWGEELRREEGKTRAEGVGEVRRAAETLRYYAAGADRPSGEVFASPRPGEQIRAVRRPVGVTAAVTPFTFPVTTTVYIRGSRTVIR
ncbi:aldehyde dehydrogenase family protein [Streptomyces atratus]